MSRAAFLHDNSREGDVKRARLENPAGRERQLFARHVVDVKPKFENLFRRAPAGRAQERADKVGPREVFRPCSAADSR